MRGVIEPGERVPANRPPTKTNRLNAAGAQLASSDEDPATISRSLLISGRSRCGCGIQPAASSARSAAVDGRDELATLHRIAARGGVGGALWHRCARSVPPGKRLVEPRRLRRHGIRAAHAKNSQRPADRNVPHRAPIASSSRSVRKYHFRSTSAGDARTWAFRRLTCSRSKVGAGAQHERLALVVGEEHLAVDADRRRREAFARRDAEAALPQHLPVAASNAVAMLVMSLTR